MADEKAVLEAVRRGLMSLDEAREALGAGSAPAGAEHAAPLGKPMTRDEAAGAVKSVGKGLYNAAFGITGMAPDVYNLLGAGSEWLTGVPHRKVPMGSAEQKQVFERLTGFSPYEPKTAAERYLAAGSEFAGAMLPSNWRQAATGIAAGMAGQGAAEGFTEHPLVARLLAQAGVLLPASLFGMRTPNTVRAVKDYVNELGPEGLRAADEVRKRAAATLHTPTILSQGSPNDELSGIVHALVQSPRGGAIRKVLRDQIGAGERAIKGFTEGIPGTGAQGEANKILDAGKGVFRRAEEMVDFTTDPLYKAAERDFVNPAPIIRDINKAMMDKNIPGAVAEGRAMQLIKTKISTVSGQKVPVLELDTVSRIARDDARAAWKAGDTIGGTANDAIADAIDKTILKASDNLRKAREAHASGMTALVDPLREGGVGQMFPATMRKSDLGNYNKFVSQLDSAKPEDIVQIGTFLRQTDKEAFPMVLRESLQRHAEKALESAKGRTPDAAFNEFANAVAGPKGSNKRLAFEAKMTQLALAQGKNPAEVVAGADEAIDALYVIARERGTGSSGAQAISEASRNWFSRLLKAASFTAPLRGAGYAAELAANRALEKELVNAFTADNGVDELIKIARFSAAKHKAKLLARGLAGMEVTNQRE